MKRKLVLAFLVLTAVLVAPQTARANMAAPQEADVGSAITFEQNDTIAVTAEVLDITVHGTTAAITATYTMKNTTAETVTTPSMFLSPNIETGGTLVTVNGVETAFTTASYRLTHDIQTDGWQYAIFSSSELDASTESRTVDTITFEMSFAPREEYNVVVSYTYALGGYPDYDFNAKRGEIEYYLTPAATWKDFEHLTINLYLDEDMPVLTDSNLDFEKVGKRTYQYISDTLPEDDLYIGIDENWFQNIFSTLRSPYLGMGLAILSPFILIGVIILVVVIRAIVRARKRRQNLP